VEVLKNQFQKGDKVGKLGVSYNEEELLNQNFTIKFLERSKARTLAQDNVSIILSKFIYKKTCPNP